MRRKKTPGQMARLISIMCTYEGIDFVYIHPSGINVNSTKVKGKMLVSKKWIDVEVDLPKYIDIAPTLFNSENLKDKMDFLKENTILSNDKRIPLPKDQLQPSFEHDPVVKKYLIPSVNIESMSDIDSFLLKHEKIVLKPARSNKGKNVMLLSKVNDHYLLGIKKEQKSLSESDFASFYEENIKGKFFIGQKYISSFDKHGNPFDCRVHVEKNGQGKWTVAKNFIRIGVGQKVVSNVSQGGGISDVKKFLKANYSEDKWEMIYENIREFSKTVPYKVEEVLDREYMTFGFDVGIDSEGKLYMFEVNDFPIVSPMKSEVAMLRASYYKYILEREEMKIIT